MVTSTTTINVAIITCQPVDLFISLFESLNLDPKIRRTFCDFNKMIIDGHMEKISIDTGCKKHLSGDGSPKNK